MTLDTPFQAHRRQPLSTSYIFFMRWRSSTVAWKISKFLSPLTASPPCSSTSTFFYHFIEFRTSGLNVLDFFNFCRSTLIFKVRWKKKIANFERLVRKGRISVFRPVFEKKFSTVVLLENCQNSNVSKKVGDCQSSEALQNEISFLQSHVSQNYRQSFNPWYVYALRYQYYYVDLRNLQMCMLHVLYVPSNIYYRSKSLDHSLNRDRIRNNYTSHAVWQWGR